MRELILASTSPYRRELLGRLGLEFSTHAPKVDEDSYKNRGLDPRTLAETLAQAKARAVANDFPHACIIGSDQLAVIDHTILGKPGTVDQAILQLQRLAGRAHQLITSVCIYSSDQEITFTDITTLHMKAWDQDALRRYIEHDQPLNCAGSYKLESQGIALFQAIESADHTAIVGLPLLQTAEALRQVGFQIP